MQTSETLRVLVLYEDPVMAAGLAAVLNSQSDLCVTLASSPDEAARSCAGFGVDVAVTDYQSGIDLLKTTKASTFAGRVPKVLILSQSAREQEVRTALNAGVYGYVLQGCSVCEIIDGVRALGMGRRFMCDTVTDRIAESLTRVTLTARETEVLELLRQGLCNKGIAKGLGIATGTVKAHVKGILGKLDASTRTQAVAVATDRGLLDAAGDALRVGPVLHARVMNLASHQPIARQLDFA